MIEEIKENEIIKVVATSETEKPTPQGDSIGECEICLDNLSDIMLPCLHAFCNQCIRFEKYTKEIQKFLYDYIVSAKGIITLKDI
jgi:hypothetical protein